jgi:glyceraldehyde 3-phosphate dehydrogenase
MYSLRAIFTGQSRASSGVSMKTFGINGFGRIGRTAFRVWWTKHQDKMKLAVINTSGSMDIENWVHLLKYDSNYGVFAQPISYLKAQDAKAATDHNPVLGKILIGGQEIVVTAQRDPAKIPWGQYGVETVIESTGVFVTREKAAAHLTAGAKTVIISAPPKGGDVVTRVIGVNDLESGTLSTDSETGTSPGVNGQIVSNASCTTNSVAPVVQILHQVFGVKKAMLTTIHSYTDDQNLNDNSHKDLRRARAAALNIVPTSTGAAISVTEILPELKGKFDGVSMRVPTPVGSLSDMTFVLARPTTIEEVNKVLVEQSQAARWQGILAVTDEPIVSSDIKGRSESAIVDLSLTNVVDGDLVKVVSWYDNEFGYCNRLVEQVGKIG